MAIAIAEENGVVQLTLGEEFVFNEHHQFREAYKDRPPGTRYHIDFRRVRYVDSSALGMLLLLREQNGANERALITLTHCNDQIRKIFEIANFSKLFNME